MIASGQRFTLALRSDGTVWAWGDNSFGQLGHTIDPDEPYSLLPVQVSFPGLTEEEYIVSVAAGENHAMALTNTGKLFTWGSNDRRQLGLRLTWGFEGDQVEPDRLSQPTQVTLNATATGAEAKVIKMVAGTAHSAALTESGRVYTWGDNSQGQLGIKAAQSVRTGTPQLVSGMSKIIDISEGATADTVRVVRYDGTMWAWGKNSDGQLNSFSGNDYYNEPVIVRLDDSGLVRTVEDANGDPVEEIGIPAGEKIVRVVDGQHHSVALLTNGALIMWGSNVDYQMAELKKDLVGGISDEEYKPHYVPGFKGIGALPEMQTVADGSVQEKAQDGYAVSIAAGAVHSIILAADQTVWNWGSPNEGRLGQDNDLPYQCLRFTRSCPPRP